MKISSKHIYSLLLIIFACSCLSACGLDDARDQAADVLQSDDPHIVFVKEGSPASYPEKTYGEAFEAFFASPTWKYFKGSDDASEETYDVVEFTGYCTYQDVEVKARLQFTLDLDSNTFETTYLSFNDVPQNMLMLAALIEAAFTNEDINDAASDLKTQSEQAGSTEAPDPETLYEQVLERYEQAMREDWNRGELENAGLNYQCMYLDNLSELGFTYMDVNSDGIEELLIGTYGGIFDCYTIIDGALKLVFQSGERVIYNICTDGSIACFSSNSAFSYSDCYYTLGQDGELRLSEAVITDSEISEDMCFYSTTSELIENAEPISFEKAAQIADKYTYLDISYVPLGESGDSSTSDTQQNGISDNDSLPAVPIDTSYPYGYYEKDGGGALEIGYTTDESALIYFRFYQNRIEGYYGGSWDQDADYEASGDLYSIDVTAPEWNLMFDETQINFSVTSDALTITAYGPLGNLSAGQISGTYYCKQPAIIP